MSDRLRDLIDQGRVLCLCERKATGTTPSGEPECADPNCHRAEMVALLAENRELRAALERYRVRV
jgi:hypothetical protein